MLNVHSLKPEAKHGFKKMDLSYWNDPISFNSNISNIADLKGLEKQISIRKKYPTPRKELCEIFFRQYGESLTPELEKNIQLLSEENTFTVCCAHQPLILGGYAFWFYKIIHVIYLCKYLKEQFPDLNFIPIYYCGVEDHDFEEVAGTRVFHHDIKWNIDSAGSPVGTLDPGSLQSVFDELQTIFQRDSDSLKTLNTWKEYALSCNSYTSFYRHFFHNIFGAYGALFFSPDDPVVKKLFFDVSLKELTQPFIRKECASSIEFLTSLDYDVQAMPRDINLFLIKDGKRRRISEAEDGFILHPGDEFMGKSELLQLIINNPASLSPNVLCRPLLQETILPNILFVGGGAEISYWLQLKSVFDYCGIPYPILIRRFSAIFVENQLLKKMNKLKVDTDFFFQANHEMEKAYIKDHDAESIKLETLDNKYKEWRNEIFLNYPELDKPTLQHLEVEMIKADKQWELVKSKIQKFFKNKHSADLDKLQKIKSSVFPNNQPQERAISFLPYYLKYKTDIIDTIIKSLQGMEPQLLLIEEQD